MPMQPNEIKAALVLAEVSQAAIAREADFSPAYVSDVIAGNRRNARIEQLIASAIGKPVARVFAARSEAAVA
jgi:lambda repressor-like predicted transcriptional regulator